MNYSQENKKFLKIYNAIIKNSSDLNNKENDQSLLYFQKTAKSHETFYDTGWISKALDPNDVNTLEKGALLPNSLSVDFSETVELPENLVPYTDFKLFVKTTPDSTLTTYDQYDVESIDGEYVVIRGNGGLVYRGTYPPEDNNIASQLKIDDGDIPESHTKKVWKIEVLYTDTISGDNFRVIGELQGIKTEENTRSCDTNEITDDFESYPFLFGFPSYNKITDFSETGFTAIGDETDRTFSTPSPTCDVDETETNEVTRTKTFSSVGESHIKISGSRQNITQSTNGSGNFNVKESEITSFVSITFQGYRPYYSSLTQREVTIGNAGYLILENLPDTDLDDILPYSSLTLTVNPLPITTKTDTHILLQSTFGNLVNGNAIRKEYGVFQISEGTNFHFSQYKIKAKLGLTVLTKADTIDPNGTYDTQEDTYSVSGTSYTRTNATDAQSRSTYITQRQDVQYRVMLIIKNPLFYREQRNYDNTK
jgi:hypothetical protein